MPEIVSVNVSAEKGGVKKPVPEAVVGAEGLEGDAHAGPGSRQVSLLPVESVERFAREIGRDIAPGEFAENLTARGLGAVAPLDRLMVWGAELEVAQIGKSCHDDACPIRREVGRCVMPEEGIFSRVRKGGTIRPGDTVIHVPKVLRFAVITVSDRAHRGEYEDRSGPRVRELVEEFARGTRWRSWTNAAVVPDDADALGRALDDAREADVILTTGGTGIGPRDVTPDVVAARCARQTPGIMEHIRVKFGGKIPNALLSRGVAGVMGSSLVYTLPGSVRAVEEYMGEIAKTLEHAILMLHGLDVHG
ncbi:MAG: molybdenum cofactor synthesis domain-containing protein [Planctomycetota bacterium]|jgi:molybdenum cofactor synthesis domain-containing protein